MAIPKSGAFICRFLKSKTGETRNQLIVDIVWSSGDATRNIPLSPISFLSHQSFFSFLCFSPFPPFHDPLGKDLCNPFSDSTLTSSLSLRRCFAREGGKYNKFNKFSLGLVERINSQIATRPSLFTPSRTSQKTDKGLR